MIAFADTSLLCSLFRIQDNSPEGRALAAASTRPLGISSLVVFEFRQSARLQVFRFSHDRKQGYSESELNAMLVKLDQNIADGALKILPVEWPDVHSLAERLSARHTPAGGHRTLDVLHVATALQCGAAEFLTLDANQATLAHLAGLKVTMS